MKNFFYVLYLCVLTVYVNAAPDDHKYVYLEAQQCARYLLCILQEAAESSSLGAQVLHVEHLLQTACQAEFIGNQKRFVCTIDDYKKELPICSKTNRVINYPEIPIIQSA